MDAFLHSLFLITFAEMGDKTQLLAIILAARYRKPFTIIAGILIATTINHGAVAYIGNLIGNELNSERLQWFIAFSFIAIGLWVLIPDKLEDEKPKRDNGAFITTLLTFFVAEMGDKTQLATIALAAEHKMFVAVTLGTTLGMLTANVPAVFFGHKLLKKIPMRTIHIIASAMFVGFGLYGIGRLLIAG